MVVCPSVFQQGTAAIMNKPELISLLGQRQQEIDDLISQLSEMDRQNLIDTNEIAALKISLNKHTSLSPTHSKLCAMNRELGNDKYNLSEDKEALFHQVICLKKAVKHLNKAILEE